MEKGFSKPNIRAHERDDHSFLKKLLPLLSTSLADIGYDKGEVLVSDSQVKCHYLARDTLRDM